jgi:hypothetical protein
VTTDVLNAAANVLTLLTVTVLGVLALRRADLTQIQAELRLLARDIREDRAHLRQMIEERFEHLEMRMEQRFHTHEDDLHKG